MPYVDVFKLMEFANNMADKSIDANDIARFPWAEVQEVKHGKWTHDGSKWANRFICSECGYKLFDEPTNFCPHCGAKMDEEGGADA